MKKIALFLTLLMLLSGCSAGEPADIAATTLPVYEFTARLCEGTGITVTRLVTENVSCLHDYALKVDQVRSAEAADLIVISGGGLEDFMDDVLDGKQTVDASSGIELAECHKEGAHEEHHHEADAHFWLSVPHAKTMAQNICTGLIAHYPEHKTVFDENLSSLLADMDKLQTYGENQLADLSCRELITFHDGFSYFAHSFDLTILKAMEEESGSEASAAELKELCLLVQEHSIPAIFTEMNGSTSAAFIVAQETGAKVCTLDMAMAGESWFDAMYRNIDTVKEALS